MPRKTTWAIALTAVLSAARLCTSQSPDGAGLLIADNGFGGVLRTTEPNRAGHDQQRHRRDRDRADVLEYRGSSRRSAVHIPVPKGASVANFSMWIDGKEMVGEVVEKKRAREIYESYKQNAAIRVCSSRSITRRFEMRIFPIPAGAEQRVQIAYYQELDFDHDWATYVYPWRPLRETGPPIRIPDNFLVVGGCQERSADRRDEESLARRRRRHLAV